MASKTEYAEAIIGTVTPFVARDITSLARTDDLGLTMGFATVSPELSELLDTFRTLGAADLPNLSLSALEVTKIRTDEIAETLKEILGFDATGPEVARRRATLIGQVERVHRDTLRDLRPVLTELQLADIDLARLRVDAQGIIADLRAASGSRSVSEHAEAFKKELSGNRKQAAIWLALSIAVAGALIVGSIVRQPRKVAPDASLSVVVAAYGVHLVLLTIGLTFMLQFIKFARMNLSQAAVNAHRVRALETFQSFINASEPGPIRDSVMLETTHAIFAHIDDRTSDSDNPGWISIVSTLLQR